VSGRTDHITLAGRLRRVNRITLGAALGIVAVIVVASSFTLGLLSLIDTTRLQAKVLAENAGASLMFQDAKSAQELLQPLRNLPQVHDAVLYTAAGQVFARYESAGHPAHALTVLDKAQAQSVSTTHIDVVQPVLFEGQGRGMLQMSVSLDALYQQTLWQLLAMACAALLAMVERVILLGKKPGASALTVMPLGPHSPASVRVKLTTAPLLVP